MDSDIAGKRLQALERLYTSPHSGNGQLEKFSTETLLDILIVLYDECNTTVMKRDKRVLDFLEVGMFSIKFCHVFDFLFNSTYNLRRIINFIIFYTLLYLNLFNFNSKTCCN